jgi:hypothetical protein
VWNALRRGSCTPCIDSVAVCFLSASKCSIYWGDDAKPKQCDDYLSRSITSLLLLEVIMQQRGVPVPVYRYNSRVCHFC